MVEQHHSGRSWSSLCNCLSIPTAPGIPHITVNHLRIVSAAHKAPRSNSAGLHGIPPISCVWVESISGKWVVFLETGSSSPDGYYYPASRKLAAEYFLKGFSGRGSITPILGGQVASLFVAFFLILTKLSDTDSCRSSGRTQCLLRSIRHTDARGLIPSFRLAGPLSLAHRLPFFGAGYCSHAGMNTTLAFTSV